MKKQWLIEQVDGKPAMTDWQKADFHDYAMRFPKVKYHLTPIENKRTLTQNRYYWLYLGIIERETGGLSDDLHEFFRRKLLPPKFIKVLGEEVKIPRSTTELSKVEFGEYLEKICALTEVPLPDPQEAGYLPTY